MFEIALVLSFDKVEVFSERFSRRRGDRPLCRQNGTAREEKRGYRRSVRLLLFRHAAVVSMRDIIQFTTGSVAPACPVLLLLSALLYAQSPSFIKDCQHWIDKKRYSTDYIEQKTGKRQPSLASEWRVNVSVQDVQPGDVVLIRLRAPGPCTQHSSMRSAGTPMEPSVETHSRMELGPNDRSALSGDGTFRQVVATTFDHSRYHRASLEAEPAALESTISR